MRFYPFVSTGNGASSRGTRRTDNARGQLETGRFLFWTEDCCGPRPCGANRMHAAVDDRYYSYYAYDHSGGSCGSRELSQACLSYAEMEQRRRSQRRLKLTGDNKLLDVNADFMATYTILNEPTLYPSAYMVLTNKGYTKHYYAGTERVAARLGGGGLDALYHVIGNDEELQVKADMLFKQSLEQVNHRVLHENDLDCIMQNEFSKEEFGYWIDDIPHQMKAEVEIDHGQFKDMVNSMLDDINHGQEKEVYFYHSDHLGSASWITDFSGMAVQHIQYLPYGEPYINQRPFGYSERFTFTGKERDEETGYGYFGARYMDHELMTMWLSVDPMADKYPSISPYAYCAWNPVKLVDPDGREFDPATEEKYIKPYENEVKARMDEINRRRGTTKWNDKYDVQYQEYEKILTEIDGLRKDQDNVYSIRTDESSDAKNKLVYKGEREDRKRSIQINLKKRAGMSSVAHELKHAYQYYEGRLGFILDPSGKHVSSNDCKIFEREAFTRGNMFEDALFSKGGRLHIYNVNPDNYKFQNNSQYENYQEYSIISAPSGYTYISNHKKISF